MPKTTKTYNPAIIILPKPAQPTPEPRRPRMRRPNLLTLLCSLLALIALIHFIVVAHQTSPTPTSTTCSGMLRTTDYTQVVHLQPASQVMGAVEFVNQLVGGQPATLVEITGTDTEHTMDVYIFGCSAKKQGLSLTTLFAQRGLPEGTVSISSDNTLVIGELDTTLSPQNAALQQPLQQNVYREYRWHNGAFVQVPFPSLYPVTSRSEAEALQQQANSGQSLPWSDPLATAEQMAKDLFKWVGNNPQDAVLNNNGVTAQVQLIQQNPQVVVTVTLERLIQHNNSGLWFVTAAQAGNIWLDQSILSKPDASPLTITGTGALADGTITAQIFDHTLSPIALSNTPAFTVDAGGNFTGTLSFSGIAPDQEGLLLLQSLPPNGSTESGRLLLVKLILG